MYNIPLLDVHVHHPIRDLTLVSVLAYSYYPIYPYQQVPDVLHQFYLSELTIVGFHMQI